MKIKLQTKKYSINTNKNILKLTPNNDGIWKDFNFIINNEDEYEEEIDYLVVFEGIDTDIKIQNVNYDLIFIAGESESIKKYNKDFLNQFDHIITCQRSISHPSKFYSPSGHTWFINKTYNELKRIIDVPKTKLLSIIVSNKVTTKGHRKRLEFCLKLKKEFGNQVDLFGRGFNEFDDKWDVLAPYKYSISIENSNEKDWITEKIGDCFLAHTFPFYSGAPNIENYFNKGSYLIINLDDFEASYINIKKILEDKNFYQNSLSSLKESKNKYMDSYTMIPIVHELIKSKLKIKEKNRRNIIIKKESINLFDKILIIKKRLMDKLL